MSFSFSALRLSKAWPLDKTLVRFILNGLVATAVHYGFLLLFVEGVGLRPVGLANTLAACIGILASFMGNRHYVFQHTASFWHTWHRFIALYGTIALLHGVLLYLWSDWQGWNYSVGFVLVTGAMVALSFTGNKFWVFHEKT